MDLFGKAREAFAQVTSEVSKGTEYLSVQSQLGNVSAELDRQLIEVGKKAREMARQGLLKDQQLELLLRGCDDLEAQMMALRQQAQDLQQKPEPPAPPPVPVPPAPAAAKCPGCGAEVAADAKFCGACGGKLEGSG